MNRNLNSMNIWLNQEPHDRNRLLLRKATRKLNRNSPVALAPRRPKRLIRIGSIEKTRNKHDSLNLLFLLYRLVKTRDNQTTVKSRSGKTLGATRVQIYMRVVTQDMTILTQKPKSLDTRSPVVKLADVQFVTSMPM